MLVRSKHSIATSRVRIKVVVLGNSTQCTDLDMELIETIKGVTGRQEGAWDPLHCLLIVCIGDVKDFPVDGRTSQCCRRFQRSVGVRSSLWQVNAQIEEVPGNEIQKDKRDDDEKSARSKRTIEVDKPWTGRRADE